MMNDSKTPLKDQQERSLEKLAQARKTGLMREYAAYLRHTGHWWLLPIFLMLALIGTLVILGGSAAAPFIYALF